MNWNSCIHSSLVAQWLRIRLPMQEAQETLVQPLAQEDPLEWKWQSTPVFLSGEFHGQRIPGGLQSMVSKRVGHNLETVVDSLEQLQNFFYKLLYAVFLSFESYL